MPAPSGGGRSALPSEAFDVSAHDSPVGGLSVEELEATTSRPKRRTPSCGRCSCNCSPRSPSSKPSWGSTRATPPSRRRGHEHPAGGEQPVPRASPCCPPKGLSSCTTGSAPFPSLRVNSGRRSVARPRLDDAGVTAVRALALWHDLSEGCCESDRIRVAGPMSRRRASVSGMRAPDAGCLRDDALREQFA